VKVPSVRQVAASPAAYPVTIVYLAAAGVLAAIVGRLLRLDVGLALLALVAVLVVLASMHREMSAVHGLVNSQHDDLVARVSQLTAVLRAAGVRVPNDDDGVDLGRSAT
jgi:hypothetical protein